MTRRAEQRTAGQSRPAASISRRPSGIPTHRGRAGIWHYGVGPKPDLQDIRGDRVSEDAIGAAFFDFCMLQRHGQLAAARLIYHIPNGGQRAQSTAARLQQQGVRAGIPDYHLPVARGGFHSLYIELKAADGDVSPEQAPWLIDLQKEGHAVCVAFGLDAAIEAVTAYLRL